ncbi:MAG: GerMN domain-containing protein [Streptosporangiales bacterium]
MSPERDPLEERLRAALEARAEETQPRGDGLNRIRSRVARRKRLPFLAHPALAAAGSAGVLVIAVSAAAAGTGQIPGTPPWANSGAQSTSTTERPRNQTTPSSSESTASTRTAKPHTSHRTPGGTKTTGGSEATHKPKKRVSVPVYYLAKSGNSWSLQKTDQSVTLHGKPTEPERAEAALEAMLDDTGPYASPWQPGTTVADTSLSASTLNVALSASAASGTVDDGEAAQAALRQLVYTATAAAPSASSVRLTIGGRPTTRFWGWVPVSSSGVSRGDPGLTQPLNTITAPSADATVSSPVTISGSGSYAQSSVDWQITQNGAVVQSGSESTGTTGFADWSTTVDLDPGTYKLRTYDGAASGDQNAQTVRFTVDASPSASAS